MYCMIYKTYQSQQGTPVQRCLNAGAALEHLVHPVDAGILK